jgi:hypothetical protein
MSLKTVNHMAYELGVTAGCDTAPGVGVRAAPRAARRRNERGRVFVLADRTLAHVVTRIRPDQWDMTMPTTFAMRNRAGAPTL